MFVQLTAKEQQQGHGPGDDNTATSTRTTGQLMGLITQSANHYSYHFSAATTSNCDSKNWGTTSA